MESTSDDWLAESGPSGGAVDLRRDIGGIALYALFRGEKSEQALQALFLDEAENLPPAQADRQGARPSWLLEVTGTKISPLTLFRVLSLIFDLSRNRCLPRVAVVAGNPRYADFRNLVKNESRIPAGSLEVFYAWPNACRWLHGNPSALVQALGPRMDEAAFSRTSLMDRQGVVYQISGRVSHQQTLEAVGRMRDGGKRVVAEFLEADLLESLVCGWEDLAEAYVSSVTDNPLRMGILCRDEQVPFMKGFASALRRNRQVPTRVFTDIQQCADWVGIPWVDLDRLLLDKTDGPREKYQDSIVLGFVDGLKVKKTPRPAVAGPVPPGYQDYFLFDHQQGTLFRYVKGRLDVGELTRRSRELWSSLTAYGYRCSIADFRDMGFDHLEESDWAKIMALVSEMPDENRACFLVDPGTYSRIQGLVDAARPGRGNVAAFVSQSVACSFMGLDSLLIDFALAKLRIESVANQGRG